MPIKKVTKKDWLWAGISFFSKGGINALNVEKMAKALKCTKGSFYWYFKSRDDYIMQLIDLWAADGTESFIDDAETAETPQAKLKHLITEVLKDRRGADFEFYLRHHGQKNPAVKELIEKTEKRRISFMAHLLQEAQVADYEAKAEIIYYYYLGWYEHNKHFTAPDEVINQELRKIALISGLEWMSD
ncbi:MAG: TetR/AcrR family transcriptional regulator [Calditrichaeota bacterium]|nr:MAG: TetR/AcrR family transcriptional regulator [Calditrichota bacterium]MBL1207892.1 TetR/AcrR family transcriptional regulator [Calditrichota bacterium]NOG47727.1 TetR/AcrR family transcriptional regulator [Calditrichota bacterium]